MAVQQLTQPIINTIAAFDATIAHEISFSVIGGAQVLSNRLVISENRTGSVVYDQIQSSLKFAHIIPANTLQNGSYYNAVIYTIDNAQQQSEPSVPVPFYCYTRPALSITNIPVTETIENGTYEFTANYAQNEGELLDSYKFILYDSNKQVLTESDLIYYAIDSSLAYTFVGMSNDTSYYIEVQGQTVNKTSLSSGLQFFTVRYIQPASFAICDLVNNCNEGYIQISSNIVAIDGFSNPDPPIYIDNKEVDLRGENVSIEQDMNNYWSFISKQAFNITYDATTFTNNIKVNTGYFTEIVYLPINVTIGREYTMTFDCDVITKYNPLNSVYQGIRYQVLNDIPNDGNNMDKEIAGGYISTLEGKKSYSISFIPTTSTVYFAFNFGTVEDLIQVETKIGNFNLSIASWVNWHQGFNIANDFTMRIWGRDFNSNTEIVNMKNNADDNNSPNRIEIKWLETEVMQTLPNYKTISGKQINIKDALSYDVKDLVINGETMSFTSGTTYNTGDSKNLINVADFNITYTQQYEYVYSTNFVLQKGFFYSLGFDYLINSTTTDLYYSIGYGDTEYTTGIIENIQYTNQTQGRNTTGFQAPANIPDNSKLFIKFAVTPILADVNVDISKVQLEQNKEATSYEEYNKYGINIEIAGKNLYDYTNPLYILNTNSEYSSISNGYSISCTEANKDSYIEIGFKNILEFNEDYSISYSSNGISNFKIYATSKNSSTDEKEVVITNGIFTSPEATYDLKFKIYIENTTAGFTANIWNIQIERGETINGYEPFNSTLYTLELDSPLRSVDTVNDCICMSTVNLLNPQTRMAKVKENTTYYFSNNTTTDSYTLVFINKEGREISSISSTGGVITTPANCYNIFVNASQGIITNDRLQIEEGDSFTQYLPYISEPSIIRNISDTGTKLDTATITPLISSQIELLNGIKTEPGILNIFTDNFSPVILKFKYAYSKTQQLAQNNFVLLKCYNNNDMPYVIHSNYIDIPESTDKIFIWVRRINNIFDLKIENLE